MGDSWDGKTERRKNNNGKLYLKFDLIKYLETDYIEKIKNALALPCKEHEERMRGMEGKIGWLWILLSGIVLGMIGILFRIVK